MVIVSHCYNTGDDLIGQMTGYVLGGSTVAMPVFFFLSGLLVTQSLDNSPTAWDFIRRRMLRLYPAAIFYVWVMAVLIGPIISTYSPAVYYSDPLFRQYLLTATLVQVYYYLPGVFSSSPLGPSVNASLWSIPMEIKLYTVLLLTAFLPRRILNGFYGIAAVLLLLAGLLCYDPIEQSFQHYLWPHFVLYPYTQLAVFFLTGVLCYRFRQKIVVRNSWLLILLLGYIVMARWGLFYKLAFLLIPMAVLYFATHGMRFFRHITPQPDLSYGLYIWAFPAEQLALIYLHPANHTLLFALDLLLTLPVALLSWYAIERPALRFRYNKGLRPQKWP